MDDIEQARILREITKKLESLTPEQRERFSDWLIERILEPVTYREGGKDYAERAKEYSGEHTGGASEAVGADAGREE